MATLILQVSSSGQRRRCDARCYNGQHARCRCVCGGRNHGAGLKQALENMREFVKEGTGLAELFAEGEASAIRDIKVRPKEEDQP